MDTMKRFRRDEETDTLLRSVDPAVPYLMASALDDALDRLGNGLTTAGLADPVAAPARRRRRTPAAVLAGGLAFLFVGGGVAVAAQYTTHTGFFGQDGATKAEWLRPDAPDFVPLARKLTADIVFAPGDSAENYWSGFMRKNDDGSYTMISTAGVQGSIGDAASCSWQRAWQTAQQAGDAAGMAAASQRIHAAAASAPLRNNNNAGYTEHLIDAADAGDSGPLLLNLKMACPQPPPATAP
jgi:hypothetical protein